MKDAFRRAAEAAGNAGKSFATSAEGVLKSTRDSVQETVSDVNQAVKNASFIAERGVLDARDAALDKVSVATGSAIKAYYGIYGTVLLLVEVGVAVVFVVAPVPTAIGLSLLLLLQWKLQSDLKVVGEVVDEVVEDDRSNRKLERITGLLKKYGQIPETATFETALLKMSINSSTGEAKGEVLAGEFRGLDLDSLSIEQLDRLTQSSHSYDSKNILGGYRSYRVLRDIAQSRKQQTMEL